MNYPIERDYVGIFFVIMLTLLFISRTDDIGDLYTVDLLGFGIIITAVAYYMIRMVLVNKR